MSIKEDYVMPLRDGSGPVGRKGRGGFGRGTCASQSGRDSLLNSRGWFCIRSNDPKDLEMHRELLKNQLSRVEDMLSQTKTEDK